MENLINIPIENSNDARGLAYAYHKNKVEHEVKWIMEWIESQSRLGHIKTDVVLADNDEVCVFVVNDLQKNKLFDIEKNKIWDEVAMSWFWKLYIRWA